MPKEGFFGDPPGGEAHSEAHSETLHGTKNFYRPSNASNATLAQRILYLLSKSEEPQSGPYMAKIFNRNKSTVRCVLHRLRKKDLVVAAKRIGRETHWRCNIEDLKKEPTIEKVPWPLPGWFWQPGEPLYLHDILWFHATGVKRYAKVGIKLVPTIEKLKTKKAEYARFSDKISVRWRIAKNGSIDIRIKCKDKGMNAQIFNQVIEFTANQLGIPAKSFVTDPNWKWFGCGFRNIRGDPWFSEQKAKGKPQFGVIRISTGADWFCQLYEKEFLDDSRALVHDYHYQGKPELAPTIPEFAEFISDWNRAVSGGVETWKLFKEVKTITPAITVLQEQTQLMHQEYLMQLSQQVDLIEELRQERLLVVEKLDNLSIALSDLASVLAREDRLK